MSPHTLDEVSRSQSRFQTITTAYVEQCLRHRDTPRASELADYLGLSPVELTRGFKRETGVLVGRFMRGLQIRMALQLLLLSDDSVREIGEQWGFRERSFPRAFRRETGCSPTEYRMKKMSLASASTHFVT